MGPVYFNLLNEYENTWYWLRSSHRKCSVRKGVLRNFAKFTAIHLCQSLFFKTRNFIKKETLTQVFSCEFCEISKNTFLTDHLWATASRRLRPEILSYRWKWKQFFILMKLPANWYIKFYMTYKRWNQRGSQGPCKHLRWRDLLQ